MTVMVDWVFINALVHWSRLHPAIVTQRKYVFAEGIEGMMDDFYARKLEAVWRK